MSDRQDSILLELTRAVQTERKQRKARTGSTSARRKVWKDSVRSATGIEADYPVFDHRFKERFQVFDARDLTVYEYHPGPNFRESFFHAVLKASAMLTLHELKRLRLCFVTTPARLEQLQADKLVTYIRHSQRQNGLSIDIHAVAEA